MTRRSPSQYNWGKLQFDEQLMKKHFTPQSSKKVRYIVAHHMTIIGNGRGSALDACYRVWQTRKASAQYGVDGKYVRQFVWDKDYAWAAGDTAGNAYGIHIEHANSTAGPGWRVSKTTWMNGARLAGYLHHVYKMGRPVKDVTLRKHSSFYATSCPGPYLGGTVWNAYVKEAQRVYDAVHKGKSPGKAPAPKPSSKPKKAPVGRMNPRSYFVGAHGSQVTWLGQRLVAHGFGRYYKVGPGPNFTGADKKAVAAFQRAQGWRGKDADGLPGAQSLRLLKNAPKKKAAKKKARTLTSYKPSQFYIGQKGAGVTMLGKALVRHGFGRHYKVGPGPTFTEADRLNVRDFQLAQGWRGKDADGFPGVQSLKRLSK